MPHLSILEKCPTGIFGFDKISDGGLPRNRPTLISGSAGSGKTLFSLEFILHGIEQFNENGVFLTFEESQSELITNVTSLGFDLGQHQNSGRLRIVSITLEPDSMLECGDYDLAGFFLQLETAIQAVGAKRVVLDAVENLFTAFANLHIIRKEFRRLMMWLKDKKMTAIITTERGSGDAISRHGLEEYIADCVIVLENRIERQLATRKIRIAKYRGSAHGSNEYPFEINNQGFSVLPITSAGLTYPVSMEKISSGIESLDEMLSGGYFRGSMILATGTSGTGKSSIAAHLINSFCQRGETSLYVALEESPLQIERNMKSIGINLTQWRESGMLHFHAVRPTANGLETHLNTLYRLINKFNPRMVVLDPVTALDIATDQEMVKLMLIRAVDLLKDRGITSFFTCLTSGNEAPESTEVDISSLADVWLLLRNLEVAGERTRGLYVCKARGMAHSNQIREFVLADTGIQLMDVMLDNEGQIIIGSMRLFRQNQLDIQEQFRKIDTERRRMVLNKKREALELKIAVMQSEFDDEVRAMENETEREDLNLQNFLRTLKNIAARRANINQDIISQ